MRDKYSYVDPDLVALYDAEAAARGEVRPLPRKKRHTSNKNQQRRVPGPPSPSSVPSTPGGLAVDVGHPSTPPQQSHLQPCGHTQPSIQYESYHQAGLQSVLQAN